MTDRWRVAAARAAARAAISASRATGSGSGTAIGGRVALAMAPDALAALGRGRVLATVSGTNGKTTTTRLLATAVGRQRAVLSNSSGANLPSGLVSVLCEDRRLPAVLEVDELYLGATIGAVQPSVVVLLNLSRDQLDRTGEAQRGADAWREALRRSRSLAPATAPTVVANCDDPRVVWAAAAARDVVWVSTGLEWTGDSHVCPRCGGPLRHAPHWACAACGLARPAPAAWLDGDRLVSPGRSLAVDLALPGRANTANAAIAAMAAEQLGVPAGAALEAMRTVHDVEGRYAEQVIDGSPCRLLLAKNPASWAATLDLVERNDRPLLLTLNARPVDGRDTSWIYDVPFERLAGRTVAVTGDAAADLSLRLGYAQVRHDVWPNALEAVHRIAGRRRGVIDAVGDYTGLQQLRRLEAAA